MNQQALSPQTTLQGGRYTILRTLGQGGFGITYLAMQCGLEREVVVKEFFMKQFCDRVSGTQVTLGTAGSREEVSRFREKFLKEARNIAQLHHPNIVQVFDVFEENGTAYYVMEYARGGSLADKVAREGALTEANAMRYIRQVASALIYLHQRSMSHLDVKPANIMLDSDDHALLIDFGLAKQYDGQSGEQTSSTPVGISEGYAAPEQYRMGGVGRFSPQTDVYALGATLYFLLTGERPSVAADVVEDGVPVDKLQRAGVSQKAIYTIEQAMQGRRKNRLQSVKAFLNCLTKGAQSGDDSTKTVPQTNWERQSERDEDVRNPVPKDYHTQPTTANQPAKSTKSSSWMIGLTIVLFVFVVGCLAFKGCGHATPTENVDTLTTDTVAFANDVQTFTVNGVSFDMVRVEGGTFTMGATAEQENEADDDEKPAHEVTLDSYYIGKTEVTQALWEAVMGDNPSEFIGPNRPVECVSWDDCQSFIAKLNEKTGKTFRLPTEAEWEYAARGGNKSQGYKYSGSNDLDEVAWYYNNSGSQTHDVATKRPNELGLYDMSGNVWEWCSDWYGDYNSASQTNPTGPSSGTYRVLRGGSWNYNVRLCRVSYRSYLNPANRINYCGLRLGLIS